jgi:hypothetical protein
MGETPPLPRTDGPQSPDRTREIARTIDETTRG